MKLNLLPQTVSKGRALRFGYLGSALILILTVIACAAMKFGPAQGLTDAKARVDASSGNAANAVATAASADDVISSASVVLRNSSLAKNLIDHNDTYPQLYADVKRYIPSFYRITSMSAVPVDGESCTVTLVGVLDSYQEYADLMLAMMRWKDAKTISRSGYELDPTTVPPASPTDTIGIPHKASEPVLPSSQLDRLAYYESQNYAPPGYLASNSYGSGDQNTRGAMPGESTVTVVMTVSRNLQVPDIAATLGSGGGGATTAALPTGGGPPGPGGGPPGAAGTQAGGGQRGGADAG
jgi:hypothetical protein